MKENSNKMETKIENIINQLQVTTQQENHDREVKYKQLMDEMEIKEISRAKDKLKRDINSYNEIILSLKQNETMSTADFSNLANKLNELYNSVLNFNNNDSNLVKLSDNDPLILCKAEYQDYSPLLLILKGEDRKKAKRIDRNCYIPISIREKILDVQTINKKKYAYLKWKEVEYYLAYLDENNIDDAIKKLINFRNFQHCSPILMFGLKLTSQKFIQKLNENKNLFSSFISDIENDILNEKICKFKSFSKINGIISIFDGILSLLKVNFTDNEPCPTVQNLLDELRELYNQFRKYAFDIDCFYKKNKSI